MLMTWSGWSATSGTRRRPFTGLCVSILVMLRSASMARRLLAVSCNRKMCTFQSWESRTQVSRSRPRTWLPKPRTWPSRPMTWLPRPRTVKSVVENPRGQRHVIEDSIIVTFNLWNNQILLSCRMSPNILSFRFMSRFCNRLWLVPAFSTCA